MPPPLTTPVAFLIFRRPEQTARVFEAIRAARPAKLLIVADGPRPGRHDDVPAVNQTRAIVERVDWPCEVQRNYAPQNMGCKPRVGSGLSWVFEKCEEAIVLEDDCLPHPSFFPYCQELLARYRADERVGWISGTDLQLGRHVTPDSYHFARNAHIWGWASWRRSWRAYDGNMSRWPALRASNWPTTLYVDPQQVAFWTAFFDQAYRGQTAWDVPWLFANWAEGRVNVVPNVNLISNIGFTVGATGELSGMHPVFHGLFSEIPLREMTFPLRHPVELLPLVSADAFSFRGVGALDAGYLRAKLAEAWSDPAATDLTPDWLPGAAKVVASGLRLEPHATDDGDRAGALLKLMGAFVDTPIDLQNPDAARHFLAAMLYLRADQMPALPLDLDRVPPWLLADYIKYLHEPPQLFTKAGESEQYATFLERWIDTLWERMHRQPIADVWWNAALQFLQSANFIGVYFSGQNLKTLFEKRARLMEFVLRRLGHAIDHTFGPRAPGKIRLGIVAAHFSPQTETFTTLPAYKHLNRDVFDIYLYASAQNGTRMERYCAGHADNLNTLPAELPQMVATIRQADLDILWIGTNVTAVTNWITLLAMHRLARVQVNSTSSCVTSGMRNVDYYLSGSTCEPAEAQAQYTEKLLLMDGPAHCMDLGCEAKRVSTEKPTRATLGVKADEILFASGANFFKIIPEVEKVWTEVLQRVPNGKLLLYPFNPNWSSVYPTQAFVARFRAALEAQGVSGDRLVVVMPAPSRADVHDRLRLADVYLDSFPFSGVNSLLDPLEVGVPPVVMDGNSFRSLMAASLMRELEIPELIAADENAYVELAVKLANDRDARGVCGRRIGEGMRKRPRFVDSEWYSAEVERLLLPLVGLGPK